MQSLESAHVHCNTLAFQNNTGKASANVTIVSASYGVDYLALKLQIGPLRKHFVWTQQQRFWVGDSF